MIPGIQQIYLWQDQPEIPGVSAMTDACWLCGGRSIALGRTIKKGINLSTFSDTNMAQCPTSPMVCAACTWSLMGKPPNTLRLRAHWWDHTGRHLTPKRGEWPELLLSPPAVPFAASIAVSGQKHIVFRIKVAKDAELFPLQFESESLWVHRDRLIRVLGLYESILRLGCSKRSVDSGDYRYKDLKVHRKEILVLEGHLAPDRGSAIFRVTGFIARKPEKEKKK